MSTPHQIRLLQQRMQRAEQDALEYAAIADKHCNDLQMALNELQKHDPAFVKKFMGVADEQAPANTDEGGVPEAPAP